MESFFFTLNLTEAFQKEFSLDTSLNWSGRKLTKSAAENCSSILQMKRGNQSFIKNCVNVPNTFANTFCMCILYVALLIISWDEVVVCRIWVKPSKWYNYSYLKELCWYFADSESSFSFAIMDLPETWLDLNSTKKELPVRLVRLEPHGKEQHKTVALICFCYFLCLGYYFNSKVFYSTFSIVIMNLKWNFQDYIFVMIICKQVWRFKTSPCIFNALWMLRTNSLLAVWKTTTLNTFFQFAKTFWTLYRRAWAAFNDSSSKIWFRFFSIRKCSKTS